MTLNVGDRVRSVGGDFIGKEGVIQEIFPTYVKVLFDGDKFTRHKYIYNLQLVQIITFKSGDRVRGKAGTTFAGREGGITGIGPVLAAVLWDGRLTIDVIPVKDLDLVHVSKPMSKPVTGVKVGAIIYQSIQPIPQPEAGTYVPSEKKSFVPEEHGGNSYGHATKRDFDESVIKALNKLPK